MRIKNYRVLVIGTFWSFDTLGWTFWGTTLIRNETKVIVLITPSD